MASEPDIEDQLARMRREQAWQRRCLNAALVALIVLAGSVCLVVFRQTSLLRREVENRKKTIAAYQQMDAPRIEALVAQLEPLAESDPRLRSILDRYGLGTSPLDEPSGDGAAAEAGPP